MRDLEVAADSSLAPIETAGRDVVADQDVAVDAIAAMGAVACTNAATNTAAAGYTPVHDSSVVAPTCSLVDAVEVIVNAEVDVVAVDTCFAACSAHATMDPMDSDSVS